MNYSDYDSDGYLSNEDKDYVPSDNAVSEDDINELEKEDPLSDDGNLPHPDGVRVKKTKSIISMRKRKKGVLKLEKEGRDGGGAEEATPSQEVVKSSGFEVDDEDGRRKKSDDLWASFLSDVGSRPKESSDISQSSTTQKENVSTLKATLSTSEKKASEPPKITITKVFDFAGEELRVNKEVSADSKEAKNYLRNQKQEDNEDNERKSLNGQPPLPSTSGKRSVGMSGILNQIGGKKQKMSTLEKSKMDWEAFKSEEGISEELAIHNRGKEGFVERKNFLERVDHRQFELEKAVRLNNMKH